MKIILTETISNLGKTGDIVNVANGYARNFLIPRSIAIVADEKNVTQIRHKKKMMEHRLAKQIEKLKEDAKQVEAVEISIARKETANCQDEQIESNMLLSHIYIEIIEYESRAHHAAHA
jgi:large subunit ribosomal protein L9